MSLRATHQIGVELHAYLHAMSLSLMKLDGIPEMTVGRYWAGVRQGGYRPVYRFKISLPGDVNKVVYLLELLYEIMDRGAVVVGAARLSARSLIGKLRKTLGLPDHGGESNRGEASFLSAISATPDDAAPWLIYSDWLVDQDDQDMNRRAAVIRGWLDPNVRLKCKYGVPLIATGKDD